MPALQRCGLALLRRPREAVQALLVPVASRKVPHEKTPCIDAPCLRPAHAFRPRRAADCQNAVLSLSDRLGVAQDIFCRCGSAFCFNCKEEAHRPVDCETVRKWMVRSPTSPAPRGPSAT